MNISGNYHPTANLSDESINGRVRSWGPLVASR